MSGWAINCAEVGIHKNTIWTPGDPTICLQFFELCLGASTVRIFLGFVGNLINKIIKGPGAMMIKSGRVNTCGMDKISMAINNDVCMYHIERFDVCITFRLYHIDRFDVCAT